jgi:hypothetical protein
MGSRLAGHADVVRYNAVHFYKSSREWRPRPLVSLRSALRRCAPFLERAFERLFFAALSSAYQRIASRLRAPHINT